MDFIYFNIRPNIISTRQISYYSLMIFGLGIMIVGYLLRQITYKISDYITKRRLLKKNIIEQEEHNKKKFRNQLCKMENEEFCKHLIHYLQRYGVKDKRSHNITDLLSNNELSAKESTEIEKTLYQKENLSNITKSSIIEKIESKQI